MIPLPSRLLGPLFFIAFLFSVPILDSNGDNVTGYSPPLIVGTVGALLLVYHLASPRELNRMLSSWTGLPYLAFGILSLIPAFLSPVDPAEALQFQLKLLVLAVVLFAAASLCISLPQASFIMWSYIALWLWIYIMGLIMYLRPGEPLQFLGHDFKPRINYWLYERYRLISVVGNTYIIGFSFTLFVPFCLYLFRRTASAAIRLGLLSCLLTALITCLLTFSKTAIISLFAMLVFHFALYGKIRLHVSYRMLIRAGLIAGFCALALILTFNYTVAYLESKYSVSLLKSLSAIAPSMDNTLGRTNTWSYIFSVAEKRGWGIFGLGSGQIFTVMVGEKGFATGCDSGFLAAFLEKGALGLLGILAFYACALWECFGRARAHDREGNLPLRTFYRMKTTIIMGFFLFEFTMQNFDTIGFQFMMVLFMIGLRPEATISATSPPRWLPNPGT